MRLRRTCVLSFLALLLPLALHAQGKRHELLPGSRVWVDGTSNKNDWTVKATKLSGFVILTTKEGAPAELTGSFTVDARSMVSEHGVIMDRLMANALKSTEYPAITYELVSATYSRTATGTSIAARGRVTIAGTTKELEQTVILERQPDGAVHYTGSQPLLMSDFGITPPTAMFGALRTGNKVVVHVDLLVKPF
jgi:polyisoprenoid-binding protein YceI